MKSRPVLSLLALLLLFPAALAAQVINNPQQQFLLIGTAMDDIDLDNPFNEVISITNTATSFALAFRDLRVKITELDHQLNLKYFYPVVVGGTSRTCGAGSPRITLLVDANGDGQFNQFPSGPDFAAHGHVNPPSFTGCPAGVWRFEDLTDELVRWEVTPANAIPGFTIGPIGSPNDVIWDTLEAVVTSEFPSHQVLSGFLVEDSGFFPAVLGKGYYDLVTIGNRTIENHHDTALNQK